jgi:hypothetical protein
MAATNRQRGLVGASIAVAAITVAAMGAALGGIDVALASAICA